jgi:tetratricopeptide (TPR) repeat protein
MTRPASTLTLTLTLSLALAALLAPAVASADDPRAEARMHFTRGQEHQEAGRYDDAIAEYKAAYAAAPIPAFLFNLGQVYRLKGDKRNAIAYYRKYVAAEPNAGPSIEAQQFINSLSADLVAEQEGVGDAPAAPSDSDGIRATPTHKPVAAPDTNAVAAASRRARPTAGSRLAARLRADVAVDLEHPGATVAAGLSFRAARWLELDLAALLGTQPGGYLGASLYLGGGAWRPMLSAGAPLLMLGEEPVIGVHGAGGLRWDPTPRLALFVMAGAFWLPTAPDGPGGFKRFIWSPSFGLQRTF